MRIKLSISQAWSRTEKGPFGKDGVTKQNQFYCDGNVQLAFCKCSSEYTNTEQITPLYITPCTQQASYIPYQKVPNDPFSHSWSQLCISKKWLLLTLKINGWGFSRDNATCIYLMEQLCSYRIHKSQKLIKQLTGGGVAPPCNYSILYDTLLCSCWRPGCWSTVCKCHRCWPSQSSLTSGWSTPYTVSYTGEKRVYLCIILHYNSYTYLGFECSKSQVLMILS